MGLDRTINIPAETVNYLLFPQSKICTAISQESPLIIPVLFHYLVECGPILVIVVILKDEVDLFTVN